MNEVKLTKKGQENVKEKLRNRSGDDQQENPPRTKYELIECRTFPSGIGAPSVLQEGRRAGCT